MKAIILAAKGQRIFRSNKKQDSSTFDWIIPAFKDAGIKDIIVIGGEDIDKWRGKIPGVKFIYNREWNEGGMLHTLSKAVHELDGPCLITYSDIIFNESVVNKMVASVTDKENNFVISIDSLWRDRFSKRNMESCVLSEKVLIDGENVTKVSKHEIDYREAYGEFAGLLSCSENGTRVIKEFCTRYKDSDEQFLGKLEFKSCHIIDLLQKIIESGNRIAHTDISGEWAELDDKKDVLTFLFKNKAETLKSLEGKFNKSYVLPQYSFSVKDWIDSSANVIMGINSKFQDGSLVIRSSCAFEDQVGASLAGQFESILDVKRNKLEISEAIKVVVDSYGELETPKDHLILVQPFLNDVQISGVIFSCDIQNGAPYITINYEDSGKTDGVTSGNEEDTKLVYIHRSIKLDEIEDPLIRIAVEGFLEIEEKLANSAIDCEFAINSRNELIIFQVRPLTVSDSIVRYYQIDTVDFINSSKKFVESFFQKDSFLEGSSTIFSDMSDWNPVEIIGSHPRPLAKSLYQYLITDSAWSKARSIIGYKNIGASKLMKNIGGHPYIDTKLCFNSYLPKNLDKKLEGKLVDAYLAKLKNNPHLYDKVEFEVLVTCQSPRSDERIEEIGKAAKLTKSEIESFKKEIHILTMGIFTNPNLSIETITANLGILEDIRTEVMSSTGESELVKIGLLLDYCLEYGTIPFSIMARYGFVASTYLKEFVQIGILDKSDYDSFMSSVETITSDFTHEIEEMRGSKLDLNDFLKKWGHLRPGTYDILSPRYDEKPDLYFSNLNSDKLKKEKKSHVGFLLDQDKKQKIEKYLKKMKVDISVDDLFKFLAEATSGREYAKFIFTQCLSDALMLTSQFAKKHGLSDEDVSFLRIESLLEFATSPFYSKSMDSLQSQVDINKDTYNIEKQIILPPMISSSKDISIVRPMVCRPNFITGSNVSGEIVILGEDSSITNLEGKIVCIENADPGFDWIFSKNILGLVTMYGGAASHMAIRCAELSIPAAIGCGETLFKKIIEYQNVAIDCEKSQLKKAS